MAVPEHIKDQPAAMYGENNRSAACLTIFMSKCPKFNIFRLFSSKKGNLSFFFLLFASSAPLRLCEMFFPIPLLFVLVCVEVKMLLFAP